MKPIEVIRRENLKSLIPDRYPTIQAMATALNRRHAQVSQWLHGTLDSKTQQRRCISNSSARFIEEELKLGVGWLDSPQGALGGGADISNRYPVLTWKGATKPMEQIDEPKEYRSCHINLGEGGFVLVVKDESMTSPSGPSFPPGTILYVSRTYQASSGRFVILRPARKAEVIFRRLAIIEGEYYFEALNPDYAFPMTKMAKNDTIVGVVVTVANDLV